MKTEIQKASSSSYQKDINRLLKTIHTFQFVINRRTILHNQYKEFVKKLLNENRISKNELKEFFIKKPKLNL